MGNDLSYVCRHDTEKEETMNFDEMTKEELLNLLDTPDEIETGCENNCDDCLDSCIADIKKILVDKFSMKRKDL